MCFFRHAGLLESVAVSAPREQKGLLSTCLTFWPKFLSSKGRALLLYVRGHYYCTRAVTIIVRAVTIIVRARSLLLYVRGGDSYSDFMISRVVATDMYLYLYLCSKMKLGATTTVATGCRRRSSLRDFRLAHSHSVACSRTGLQIPKGCVNPPRPPGRSPYFALVLPLNIFARGRISTLTQNEPAVHLCFGLAVAP